MATICSKAGRKRLIDQWVHVTKADEENVWLVYIEESCGTEGYEPEIVVFDTEKQAKAYANSLKLALGDFAEMIEELTLYSVRRKCTELADHLIGYSDKLTADANLSEDGATDYLD
jgi:hypothetical protein